jgi:hypothetical protein
MSRAHVKKRLRRQFPIPSLLDAVVFNPTKAPGRLNGAIPHTIHLDADEPDMRTACGIPFGTEDTIFVAGLASTNCDGCLRAWAAFGMASREVLLNNGYREWCDESWDEVRRTHNPTPTKEKQ